MVAECLVEGRIRLMNHNLKFEAFENSEYFEKDNCVSYDKVYYGIWKIIEKEYSEINYNTITIYSPIPLLFEELILTAFQFIHYGF